MSEKQITMDELILYLKGNAPDPLVRRIESQRAEDEEFNEEMDDWETRLREEGDAGAFFEQMKMVEKAWQETEVPIQKGTTIIFPSWGPLALAAGIALLLLSYLTWNGLKTNPRETIAQQLAQELDSKVALLIGPEAGVEDGSSRKSFEEQVWEAFEKDEFDKALEKVDSLISKDPKDLNNLLLKALIFEKYGKSEKALAILEKISQSPEKEIDINCESLWYQCLITGKNGKKGDFQQKMNAWKEGRCGELDAGRLSQLEYIGKSI